MDAFLLPGRAAMTDKSDRRQAAAGKQGFTEKDKLLGHRKGRHAEKVFRRAGKRQVERVSLNIVLVGNYAGPSNAFVQRGRIMNSLDIPLSAKHPPGHLQSIRM